MLLSPASSAGRGTPAAMDDAYTGGLCFIGTATTLIRYAGFTVLTDPNFLHRGERVYLGTLPLPVTAARAG